MEALECIKTRRSVRRFTEEPVTPEQVAEVVAAAAYAPSWKNTQIARYILVEDAQKREKIASDCVLDFTYNANTLSHAPALVALTMVTGRSGFERDGSYSSPLEGHWQSFDVPHRPSALPRTHWASGRSSWASMTRTRWQRCSPCPKDRQWLRSLPSVILHRIPPHLPARAWMNC